MTTTKSTNMEALAETIATPSTEFDSMKSLPPWEAFEKKPEDSFTFSSIDFDANPRISLKDCEQARRAQESFNFSTVDFHASRSRER